MSQTADIAESIEPYLTYYNKLDPWSAMPKTLGRAYLGSDQVDEQQLVRGEFYQDFARRFGMLRPMGMTLGLELGRLATVALNRTSTQSLLGQQEKALLQDLAIHLQGALTLRSRILAEREVGAAQGAALDAVTFGVVVCDADARIRTMNRAAAGLALRGSVTLGRRNDTLSSGTLQETRTLHKLIRAAALGQPGAMRRKDQDGSGLSILVTPLLQDGPGRALVCFRDDDAPASLDTASLARLFGFSPAQSELCTLLLAGRTFDEAAAERGIATSTARSYFLTILARTGARNLRDLLRLLGSLPQVT